MRNSQKVFKMLCICTHAHCQSLSQLVDGRVNDVPLQTDRR